MLIADLGIQSTRDGLRPLSRRQTALAKDREESAIARRYASHAEAHGRFNCSIEWRSFDDGWCDPWARKPTLDSDLRACPGAPSRKSADRVANKIAAALAGKVNAFR